jgi:hypothetical protein
MKLRAYCCTGTLLYHYTVATLYAYTLIMSKLLERGGINSRSNGKEHIKTPSLVCRGDEAEQCARPRSGCLHLEGSEKDRGIAQAFGRGERAAERNALSRRKHGFESRWGHQRRSPKLSGTPASRTSRAPPGRGGNDRDALGCSRATTRSRTAGRRRRARRAGSVLAPLYFPNRGRC